MKRIYLSDSAADVYRTKHDYAYIKEAMHDTVRLALHDEGLTPIIHAAPQAKTVTDPLTDYDGLVILGGFDVSPSLYEKNFDERLIQGVAPDIDLYELNLIRHAIAKNIPVLGICRGMQLINVAFNGTLHQDIEKVTQKQHHNFSAFETGNRLVVHSTRVSGSSVIEAGEYKVASAHHQAVNKVGSGLTVTGSSDDGVVEMIENTDANVVGVQWHPEDSHVPQSDTLTPLLAWFTEAVERRKREEIRYGCETVNELVA